MESQLAASSGKSTVDKHPLDPLSPAEITTISTLLKTHTPDKSLHFKVIAIIEPPKSKLRGFLRAERNAFTKHPRPSRLASALYYHRGTADLFQATVNLDTEKVENVELLDSRYHAQADVNEIMEMREICLVHPDVVAAVKALKLPERYKVVCDTWFVICSLFSHIRTRSCSFSYTPSAPGNF